jgi:uncharacterized protein (DUF1697 family)
MSTYIVFLRAVNVGGTGKLPMEDLRAMCETAGFTSVRTYIASGNVVLSSSEPATSVKKTLEAALQTYAEKPVGVVVCTPEQVGAVLDQNPFADRSPSQTVAIFLDSEPPADAATSAKGRVDEEIAVGAGVIYVHYGEGMGDSKLKIPAAAKGTARNMNTVAAVLKLAGRLG